MIRCAQCRKEFSGPEYKERVASIAGSIQGDEYVETYFFCAECGVYTVEFYHDRFCDEESVSVSGPVPKSRGDAKVGLIRQCSEPWNKNCRCRAHRAYFGDSLD